MVSWENRVVAGVAAVGMIATMAMSVGTLTGCGVCFIPSGCGGSGECTIREYVDKLEMTPATACLAVTASDVNSCSGDYSIEIANSCSADLDVDGQTIVSGGHGAISIHDNSDVSSGASLCTSYAGTATCAVPGSLNESTVTISWEVH